MKIMITGSSGQLGQELTRILDTGRLLLLTHRDIDIRDTKLIQRIEELKPNIIIHTAAYTDVDGCEINQDLAWSTNALGTRNIAVGAEKIKAKLFYISTDYVFDGSKKEA